MHLAKKMRFNFRTFFKLTYRAFFKATGTHGHHTPHRRKALFWWYVLIPIHNLITNLCLLMDEILFSGYRKQEVKEPIFIIGNFRSGSTLLQRLLAKDNRNITSMKTWEIYLAPSIIQRKIFQFMARTDRSLLNGYLIGRLGQRDLALLGNIPMHRVGLWEVDEDEGALLHNWTSSFLMFIFPFLEDLPPYLNFDREMPEDEKHMTMEFYYRLVQRHVYFHGGRKYLAKNPAFSAKIIALREYFPDAKFIYLVRNPLDMLASKTSFFTYIWRYFNEPLEQYPFKEMLLDLTRRWYVESLDTLAQLPLSEYVILKYDDLVGKLDASTRMLYRHFDIPLTKDFEIRLAQAVKEAEAYESKHHYSLVEMGYTPQQVYQQYKEVFERFNFELNGKALTAKVSKKYAEID
jgi:hypothetical protein